MLISDETPNITWGIAGLSSSIWETGAPFSQLTNGRPREGCRFYRGSTVGNFQLTGQWSVATRPRVIRLVGLGEEWAGQQVNFGLSNTVTASSTIDVGTFDVQRLPDDSLTAVAVVDPATLPFLVDTLTVTSVGAGEAYYVGEVVVATATEWAIRRDWTETVVMLTKELRSITYQPTRVRRLQYRKASVTIAPQVWAKSFSVSSPVTLQKLQSRLSQAQPVLVIPALRQPGLGAGAAIDMDAVLATMLFGTCTNLGQISLVSESNLSQLNLEFTESPAGRIG